MPLRGVGDGYLECHKEGTFPVQLSELAEGNPAGNLSPLSQVHRVGPGALLVVGSDGLWDVTSSLKVRPGRRSATQLRASGSQVPWTS